MLVSAVLQNPLLEHVYPLCRHRALSGTPCATRRVLTVTCLMRNINGVHLSTPISRSISPLLPLGVHPFVLHLVSLFLLCQWVHLYKFSRFCIYALMYDTCYPLSNLLTLTCERAVPPERQGSRQVVKGLWMNALELLAVHSDNFFKNFRNEFKPKKRKQKRRRRVWM